MTFNVEEKHAIVGGFAAGGLPLIMEAANVDLRDSIQRTADMLFEGSSGSLAFVTGFTVLGVALIGLAIWTDLDDWKGMLAAGLGAGMLVLAAESAIVGQRA